MPDEPPRVFLSYGVHDASELAERLHRDLTTRGYKIWQDADRIRTGWAWDNELQNGLLTSDVVLALLSPHAVRRVRDAGNVSQVDSVCLDEIAYARFKCKIPIVPVKVQQCEAPFLVYRLQHIDFRRWDESEAVYKDGLVSICKAIDSALQGETRDRSWGPLPEPLDFTLFLEAKRKNFTGRQWLFKRIEDWRANRSQPALLITGKPGVGKSAIVGALVHENPGGAVLAFHCCRADTPATLEPANFVTSIAAMLAARLDDYAEMLEDPPIVKALENVQKDPANAFETAILGPLKKLREPEEGRRFLLVDALDEALTLARRPTIVEVLSTRLAFLPSWLGVVATTRGEQDVLNQLRGLRAFALDAEDPLNQEDVRAFIQLRLGMPVLGEKGRASGRTSAELATNLLRASAGNFLFAATALDAVEINQLSLDEIEGLPPGLGSLYEVFFNRIFRDTGVGFGPSRLVFEAVVAAREPLNREQLAALSGLDPEEEVPLILARLASFLPFRDRTYALFHRSLFEWLTEWDSQQDQPIAGTYHISLKNGRSRLADWCFVEYKRDPAKAPVYCLKHLIAHLHEVGRNDEVKATLLDFNWLEAKLSGTDTNALIADYSYSANEPCLHLVRDAIRLSAHVLVRDRRQLASQLTGRLLGIDDNDIQALLKQTAEKAPRPSLWPLRANLTPPGGPLVRILEGHSSSVSGVAITPDGRRAVSASEDNTLRVWDLESGQSVRTLKGHSRSVYGVAMTPDGRRAVSASQDNTLRVWDLESGQSVRTLEGHTDFVSGVAITPDGRRAVSASKDDTLRVWDLESGQSVRTLEGHTNWVTGVAITPDGRRAVSASQDNTLRVWDLESGQSVRTLEGHSSSVNGVAITPDGGRAVSASSDNTLRVWDLESGQSVRTLEGHSSYVNGVAITPDARRAVSASEDNTLRVWDLESGQSVRTLEGHSSSVNGVAITPDGRRAVSASSDNTLRVWDLESGKELALLTADSATTSCAVSLDGRTIVAGDASGRVHFLRLVEADETKPAIGEQRSGYCFARNRQARSATDS